MGARIVDGTALWESTKLKKVPEQYRAEYANLLPLANTYGYFPYDVDLVWTRVYGYNRPNITKQDVRDILLAFVKADMVSLHKLNDRTYGFFEGIDKEGRLPPPSRRSKYKNNYPSPEDFAEYAVSQ